MTENFRYAEVPLIYECNLNCYYCYTHGNVARKSRLERDEWKHLLDFLGRHGSWNIALGQGEPFLHPDFTEFAAEAARNNKLSIITNLTHDVSDFIRHVAPDRVLEIRASLQPAVENDPHTFISRIDALKKCGFPVKATFVFAPQRTGRFDRLKELLAEEAGVHLSPLPAIMFHDGKKYPESYNREQRETLIENAHIPFFVSMIDNGHFHLSTSKLCNSGYDSIYIEPTGEIFRCIHDHCSPIGNFLNDSLDMYRGPKRCRIRRCFCGTTTDISKFEKTIPVNYIDLGLDEKRKIINELEELIKPVQGYKEFWRDLEQKHISGIMDTLWEDLHGKRILIRPAGLTTQLVLDALEERHLAGIVGVIDKFPAKSRHRINRFEVFPLESVEKLKPDVIMILHDRYAEGMSKEYQHLAQKGVRILVNPFPLYDQNGYKIF